MDLSKKDKAESKEVVFCKPSIKENYIMQTNIKNPISIEGVALGMEERTGKQAFFLMYKLYGIAERTEINEETYNFVQSLFDLILTDREGDVEEFINEKISPNNIGL